MDDYELAALKYLWNRVILQYNLNAHDNPMHITNLRKVGGSIMMAVPPAILELLHIEAGATVGLAVEDGRLIVEPRTRPRYTMSELLAASDYSQPQPPEEREWVDAPPAGREPR